MAQQEVFIQFTDQSPSYANGVEFGRVMAKIELGVEYIEAEISEDNVEIIRQLCIIGNYIPTFQAQPSGWIFFYATRFGSFNN